MGDHPRQSAAIPDTDTRGFRTRLQRALVRRLVLRFRHLCADVFDELDDFIFASGRKGQLGDDAGYLESMREIRNRRQGFEASFLTALEQLLLSDRPERQALVTDKLTPEQEELRLSLAVMRRKALKAYAEPLAQLATMQSGGQHDGLDHSLGKEFPVAQVLAALESSHQVFTLPLALRLVLFKLFEQHLVMQLHPIYAETIRILQRANSRLETVARSGAETPPADTASISSAGRGILCNRDLDEIISLLGGDGGAPAAEHETDSMAAFLALVDSFQDGTPLIFVQGQAEQVCFLRKSDTVENSYALNNRQGRLVITRSRIGLAISLRAGELRVAEAAVAGHGIGQSGENTVLELLSAAALGVTLQ